MYVACPQGPVLDVAVAASIFLCLDDNYLTAIAKCHSVDEVKDFRDKLRALEVYAKQAGNMEAENVGAVEIRLTMSRILPSIRLDEQLSGPALGALANLCRTVSKPGSAGGRGHRSSAKPTIKDHGICGRDQDAGGAPRRRPFG